MKDCFAYRRNGCSALKVRECEGCPFYKTKEQYQADQENVLEKIRALGPGRRKRIIDTYYHGELEVKRYEH